MSVVISSDFVLNEDASVVLSHPRILYDDVWRAGIVAASTESSGFPAANVSDGLTWDYWRPTELPATIEVQCSSAAVVDYALIASHTLGSSECTVIGQYYNGSIWVNMFAEYAPGTDRVVAFLFNQVTASRFRFAIDGENSPEQLPSIGIAMMGKALVMQRGLTLNHSPITMSRRTVARPNMSDGGQLLGRSISREGVRTQIEFENLESAWLRTYFEPFIESARIYPFGWVWHPSGYPAEVALLWTPSGREDIVPELAGMLNRMNVAFDAEGIIQ